MKNILIVASWHHVGKGDAEKAGYLLHQSGYKCIIVFADSDVPLRLWDLDNLPPADLAELKALLASRSVAHG